MSVSTYIFGLAELTDEYRRMASAYHACVQANVAVPAAIWEFFGNEVPLEEGMRMDIDSACTGDVNYDGGLVIELVKLPPSVTKILVVRQ